jgi:hypothetical protein
MVMGAQLAGPHQQGGMLQRLSLCHFLAHQQRHLRRRHRARLVPHMRWPWLRGYGKEGGCGEEGCG